MARVHDTRIWRVLEHHVGAAREKLDFSSVTEVGLDETSARRGQDYVSIFMDLEGPGPRDRRRTRRTGEPGGRDRASPAIATG
jgi:hypothetical protein